MMLRNFLNWILNHFPARPSDEELIAFGRQEEREEQRRLADTPARVPIIRLPDGSTVIIDPTVRARGYAESAWNSDPDKHTDKPRALNDPSYIERIRTQFEMPAIKPHQPHKHHLKPYDGPPPPYVTSFNVPAFLKDQPAQP